jgi:hypothetical protein
MTVLVREYYMFEVDVGACVSSVAITGTVVWRRCMCLDLIVGNFVCNRMREQVHSRRVCPCRKGNEMFRV